MRYHIRRMDKAISEVEEMKRILMSTEYVTIAMAKDNEPYLVSLSHGYDEANNCIYFHCAKEGKKLDYLRSNKGVWGQALLDHGYSQGECTHLYASVHFKGRVTLLKDPDEKLRALSLMARQLDDNPERLISGWRPERLAETVVGRIDIEYVTGKKSKEVAV